MTFKNIKLADLSEVITKGTTPTTMGYDFQSKGINFYKAQDLLSRYPSDTDTKISIECHDALKRSKIRKNDILVSIAGTIGRVSIWNSRSEANCNQAIAIIRCKPDVNALFSYYALTSGDVQDQIKKMTKTTAQPNLNLQELGSILIPQPSSIEQKSIASILSSLDDKIELNNKINKNLEEIAQTLYKRWFVDFEFPNENGDPYKSSGGEMVDSELGMIPQGWEVKEINLVIKNKKERVGLKIMPVLSAVKEGKLVLSSDFFTKNVPSSNISKYLIVSPREFSYNPARINIGSIGMNEFDFNGCVSPIYVVLKPDYIYVNFFSLYFKTSTFSDEVSLRASGSVRQSLNFDDLGRIKIVYPSKDSVIKFNEIYDSIYFGVKSNEKQIANLSKIRDELLPKLMSGEIEVPIEE